MINKNDRIVLDPNTIILTIGTSKIENTSFCESYLIPFFESHKLDYSYLSLNDIIKNDLKSIEFYKNPLLYKERVKRQALSILQCKVDNLSKYPINKKIIIVDYIFSEKEDRIKFIEIAKKNHYNISCFLFDNKIEINEEKYKSILRINSKHFYKYQILYEERANTQPNINFFDKYCIIGDIHGCFDELLECVTDNKAIIYEYNKFLNRYELTHPVGFFKNQYYHHILLGDYLDKGPKIKETIEFLFYNKAWFWIVKGNHETFVYKYLKGELGKHDLEKFKESKYFNSIQLLLNDEELRKKFFFLYESSYNYIKTDNFIVTHAPCEEIYLEKEDNISIKKQRNIIYPKIEDFDNEKSFLEAMRDKLSFIYSDASDNLPYHIFGHIMIKDIFKYKNKIAIDTGCVVGGKLSSILFDNEANKITFKQYNSKQQQTKKLLNIF